MNLYKISIKLISKIKQKYKYILLSFAMFNPLIFDANITDYVVFEQDQNIQENQVIYPVIEKRQPREIRYVRLTAYSSTPDQTSGNPFITASGAGVHDGTIAANFLPFGTKVRIPELYGDKIFTVEDRGGMGTSTIDVWFPSRSAALAFGVRYSTIEVL